ncbi:MAG TPA: fructose bisphosphate aldolase [Candidatus Dormibacteraeota bacterium]|nr:fructose bisphosphate aldolase [Candidatus Dormibacteraeota bacterium]
MRSEQLEKIKQGKGFIAALDQSGGSTPGALASYGIPESAYSSEAEMFELVHKMRTRIVTSPAFSGECILGAILFKATAESQIDGLDSADYLWQRKQIVPFLKTDNGLAEESNGVQLMKPVPGLPELLAFAAGKNIFGTKMRSLIKSYSKAGIAEAVSQQFEFARQVTAAGLVPIVEPEVDIHAADKAECEQELRSQLQSELDALNPGQEVMLKLTLPEEDDFYRPLTEHPRVIRVLALSGGYGTREACVRLKRNHNVIASFNRALSEGLSASQTDEEFNKMLEDTIAAVYDASTNKQ